MCLKLKAFVRENKRLKISSSFGFTVSSSWPSHRSAKWRILSGCLLLHVTLCVAKTAAQPYMVGLHFAAQLWANAGVGSTTGAESYCVHFSRRCSAIIDLAQKFMFTLFMAEIL